MVDGWMDGHYYGILSMQIAETISWFLAAKQLRSSRHVKRP